VGFFYSTFVEEIVEHEGEGESQRGQEEDLSITYAPAIKKKTGGAGFEATVPKISVGDISEPDFDGWLWKEGGGVIKNWKRRWFILKDFCLYYFEGNKQDHPALGLILILGYTISSFTDSKRDNCFQVGSPSLFYSSFNSSLHHLLFLHRFKFHAVGPSLCSKLFSVCGKQKRPRTLDGNP